MSKDIITLLVVSLITVLSWVVFEIYHSNTSVYVSPEIRKTSQPLNPEIDVNLLEHLKGLNRN